MVDTIRLILFKECNMKCSYCCNEQDQFNSQFQEKSLAEINWHKYKNVCFTGGEPFLHKDILYWALGWVEGYEDFFHDYKKKYIYTNGLLMDEVDVKLLNESPIDCVNIGLHTIDQLKRINPKVYQEMPVRFMVQDSKYEEFLKEYPTILNKDNTKQWKLNECNMPNEDWVLLRWDGKI